MHGAFGRYLDVDLTTGTLKDREIPEAWYSLHLGGRGLAARLMLDTVRPGTGAYSPDNALVFATGPFQGTGLAGAGRHVVMGVSPKTGSIADSYVGGFLGHELGRSGWDGIVIRGEAPEPVYLLVQEGRAELRPASDLWRKLTGDVDTQLKERHPGVRVACIGPAGEKRVQMACIIHDVNRSAGRPGLGAVMGAKRLKAIAVAGYTDRPLAEPDRFRSLRTELARGLTSSKGLKRLGELGTAGGVLSLSEQGILPTRNFREGTFEHAEAISGERMANTILVERETCTGCPIRCKRAVKTTFGGREVTPAYGGPEYETVAALGSLCGCQDLDAIALGNQLCNAYGLDTISAGVAVATLMEASENGQIEERVPWGDSEALVTWIERIARREGLGDAIADGLENWAHSIGAGFVMTIKGVEVPMHEPRGKVGLGISYATTPRGANHMEGTHDTLLASPDATPELGVTEPVDRFAVEGKAELTVLYENLRSFTNSLVMCVFTTSMTGPQYNYPTIRQLVGAATGREPSIEEMLTIGARNYTLLRLFAARCGRSAADDRLPERFHEPMPKGASAGRPIDRETFAHELERYRTLRGWREDGPSATTLAELGLDEFVEKA